MLMKNKIHNINVVAKEKLPSPKALKETLPLTNKARKTVLSKRKELMSILELNSSFPMISESLTSSNYLTPKISFRLNPGDMKDYSSSDRKVDVNKSLWELAETYV